MSQILIRYAEIALKGKNRIDFENQLIRNICQVLAIKSAQLKKQNKQLVISLPVSANKTAMQKLKLVFGIAWFALVETCPSQMDKISALAVKLAQKNISSSDTFAIRASRTHKTLPFTSQDLGIKIGDRVRQKINTQVNLSKPDKTIFISSNQDQTYIYLQKIPGPGGLPVGTSGKLLSLISGGFDSVISSYLMAKRGALVDFIHFHPSSKPLKLHSKIRTIINQLSQSTLSSQIYLANCYPFKQAIKALPSNQSKHKLILFRRLMAQVAEQIAINHHYQALVFGDSLGQVASQTLSNILALDQAVKISVFRPLIGLDKQEIIAQVKQLGLESTVNLPYPDCCALIAGQPATRAHLETVKQIEENINIKDIINAIVNQTQTITFH